MGTTPEERGLRHADAHRRVHRLHPELPVADLTGARRLRDRLGHGLDVRVGQPVDHQVDELRQVLDACPDSHKWPIFDRDPQELWGIDRVYLLGDACHPMTPYMAQGAASALEDAAMLSRCLEHVNADGVVQALRRYEANRLPRTAEIQQTSSKNTWMRNATDPTWVYGYDVWTVPLVDAN